MKVIVTGGAHGIGLATARLFHQRGGQVWVFDIEQPPCSDLLFTKVDVTQRSPLEHAFGQVGVPDVVVINAGCVTFAPLVDTSADQWNRIVELNLSGAFHTLQLAARSMIPARHGAIVITASTNSYDGEADLTAYNATKAGLLGLLHTAANELGPYGIRVNAVCPGLIRTRLTEPHFSNPHLLKEYFRHIPLGRGGLPEEVARAIAFLASEEASYITGAALLVDGGQMAAKFSVWSEERAEFQNDHWVLRPKQ